MSLEKSTGEIDMIIQKKSLERPKIQFTHGLLVNQKTTIVVKNE